MIGLLPIKISHEVYLLGSYELNIYLVRGKKCALIEGGSSTQFPLLLEQLNYLEISPHDIEYLIVLHSHADHIMTFPPLQEMFPWMQIAAFSGSNKVFDDARIVDKLKELDRDIAHSLAEAGLGNSEVYHLPSPHYPMDIPLKGGDLIELGDKVNLKVIETPGHAPDSISLYLASEEVLFISDAIGIFYPPDDIKPDYFYHLGMYETSLERIRDIGAKVLCKGHQGMLIGERIVKDYIKLAFIGVERFKKSILDAIDEGRDEDEVCREITDTYHKGILGLFPWESNFKLCRLLIRRTLEYLDTPTHFKE